MNVNCECYPRGNSRSRKTSLSLTRHCLSRVRERERGAAAARRGRWWTAEAGQSEQQASVILLPSRALTSLSVTLVVQDLRCLLYVESFTTGAAPVEVVRSPSPPPPPLLAQFAPHRRFIASHHHNAGGEQCRADRHLPPSSILIVKAVFFHPSSPAPQTEACIPCRIVGEG